MILFDHKIFYKKYAYDYYLYKVGTFQSILADIKKFDQEFLSDFVEGADQTEYSRFVKSEIRMTCFHAIETLFEIIFALEPKDGELRDEKLLQTLTTAKPKANYDRIGEISKDINKLYFLDEICIDSPQVPLWMHIFYFKANMEADSELKEELLESRKAIRYFLYRIAETFHNRAEYNAYKHGLRIMHTLDHFSLGAENDPNPYVEDLSNSMSLFSIEKDKVTNKPVAEIIDVIDFDTNTDLEVIKYCYLMIKNIIASRKAFYVHQKTDSTVEMFSEEQIRKSIPSSYGTPNIQSRTLIKD